MNYDLGNKENNLFHVIASSLAKSNLQEIYLIASHAFDCAGASAEVEAAIEKAWFVRYTHDESGSDVPRAINILAAHFIHSNSPNVCFMDGVDGLIVTDGVGVEFNVLKIGQDPLAYRVLFSRIDVAKLRTHVSEEVTRLSRRVERLEAAVRAGAEK